MALPAGPLPVPASLAPITDEELASAGGLRRMIVMRAVFAPATAEQPPGSVVHPGGEVDDWFYRVVDHESVQDRVRARHGERAGVDRAGHADRIRSLSSRAAR